MFHRFISALSCTTMFIPSYPPDLLLGSASSILKGGIPALRSRNWHTAFRKPAPSSSKTNNWNKIFLIDQPKNTMQMYPTATQQGEISVLFPRREANRSLARSALAENNATILDDTVGTCRISSFVQPFTAAKPLIFTVWTIIKDNDSLLGNIVCKFSLQVELSERDSEPAVGDAVILNGHCGTMVVLQTDTDDTALASWKARKAGRETER